VGLSPLAIFLSRSSGIERLWSWSKFSLAVLPGGYLTSQWQLAYRLNKYLCIVDDKVGRPQSGVFESSERDIVVWDDRFHCRLPRWSYGAKINSMLISQGRILKSPIVPRRIKSSRLQRSPTFFPNFCDFFGIFRFKSSNLRSHPPRDESDDEETPSFLQRGRSFSTDLSSRRSL
jgi:hypothetical protein